MHRQIPCTRLSWGSIPEVRQPLDDTTQQFIKPAALFAVLQIAKVAIYQRGQLTTDSKINKLRRDRLLGTALRLITEYLEKGSIQMLSAEKTPLKIRFGNQHTTYTRKNKYTVTMNCILRK